MDFTEKDFSKCAGNPLYKNLFRTYPNLKKLIEGRDSKDSDQWEQILKFIIAVYDPNSPLIKEYQDIQMRKQAGATIAGYDLAKDELTELFMCQGEIADVISEYLKKYGNSRLWSLLQGDLQLFYEYNVRIFKSTGEDRDKDVDAMLKRSRMSAEAQIINDRIELNEQRYYGGDDDLINEVKKPTRITPESISNKAINATFN